MSTVIAAAIAAGRKAAKTKSPSQETADKIGTPLSQGIAMGMVSGDGLGAITNAAEQVTQHALSALGGGRIGAANGGGGGGGGRGGRETVTVVSQPVAINLNGQTVANTVLQLILRQSRGTGNALGRYAGGSQTAAATSVNANAIAR